MRVEVKVPQLPESVTEATLVTWHKKPGDAVSRDENLIDVETDKVVLELPAPVSGALAEILKGDGSTVAGQDVIAIIDTDAKGAAVAATPASQPAEPAAGPAAPAAAAPATALPAARKIMAEQGVASADVSGTGRGGRITKGDVLAAVESRPAPAPPTPAAKAPPSPAVPLPPALGNRPEQRVPMSRLRQRVAERLVQSQSTAAILTTFNEVNMQPIIELRNKYKERFEKEHGVKLGFMGFFVKAAVHALKKFPAVNASIDGNDIVYHGYFDIGIAVGSPRGLVVPILRDADQLSIAEIEAAIADFGKRAQDGKLTVEDLTGGTYTISNGGVFGSMLSTPIINPPQSAILAVAAGQKRPVVKNDALAIATVMTCTLSVDHRVVDGALGARWLREFKRIVEDPLGLLL
jgi:2-oxoglutarate dehydrogenase E2 component (dihydrolipoamide succinyltransferase)